VLNHTTFILYNPGFFASISLLYIKQSRLAFCLLHLGSTNPLFEKSLAVWEGYAYLALIARHARTTRDIKPSLVLYDIIDDIFAISYSSRNRFRSQALKKAASSKICVSNTLRNSFSAYEFVWISIFDLEVRGIRSYMYVGCRLA
jgi:hypothetical protein